MMVTGRPAATRRRIRNNGAESRPKWALSLHAYAASSARTDMGVQNIVAAVTARATTAIKRNERLTGLFRASVGDGRQFRTIDDDISQKPAKAIVNPLGDVGCSRCSIQIEHPTFVPPLHNSEAVE